jgi:hypothetical protein
MPKEFCHICGCSFYRADLRFQHVPTAGQEPGGLVLVCALCGGRQVDSRKRENRTLQVASIFFLVVGSIVIAALSFVG